MPSDTNTYASDDLLTTAEVAELAKISKITVTRAVKAGRITPLRTPGGHFRFRRGDVDALLSGQAASGPAGDTGPGAASRGGVR
ncbi:excisionase family DNA-binding protein [Mycobacterium sp. CSUR Q5927]|nr:excisionase family DNA-binding protein [Mycobacterium sp. CSUR Q5927]